MQPELVKKRLFTTVISAPAAVALLTFVLLWHLGVERQSARSFDHHEHLLAQAQAAISGVLTAQNAFQRYSLSAAAPDHAAFTSALDAADASLKRLLAMGSGDRDAVRLLNAIGALRDQWKAAMLDALKTQPFPGAIGSGGAGAARVTQSLLQDLNGMIGAETALRGSGTQSRLREWRIMMWLVPAAAALFAILLIYVTWNNNAAIVREYERVLADSEEANLKTNNFLATVSHELRNPLNLILLWSRLLLSGDRDEDKISRGLTAIDRAAQAQAQLIEDLLDFAKIESGRLRLDMQPTDLSAVVKAGVDAMAPAAEAKSIELRAIIDPRAAMILGDPNRLQQALWNLLSNAVKFTPGGGHIQVQLARINSHVELAVSDSGQGIAPALLPHVFDRFWQADAPSQAQKKGMGLGLTIVKYIVTMHGGTIRVESGGIGKGAVFTVRLPLPSTAEDFQYQRRPHPTITTTPSLARIPRLTGLRIIVVDDDQEATEALRGVLKSLGAEPIVADGADRALQLLSEYHPDAMVSDIAMPGRDGLSLAREIRRRERSSGAGHLPLVALTAYGRVEDRVKVFSAGFDSHVVKPVDPAELAEVIRTVVEPTRESL